MICGLLLIAAHLFQNDDKRKFSILTEPADRRQAINSDERKAIEKLFITDKRKVRLTGLLTLKDTEQAVLNPTARKDKLGRLGLRLQQQL